MRPAELADVLEGLSGPGRQELLASLDAEVAADASPPVVAEQPAAQDRADRQGCSTIAFMPRPRS
jgi:hypothetical protein